jgi:hypothetical protein
MSIGTKLVIILLRINAMLQTALMLLLTIAAVIFDVIVAGVPVSKAEIPAQEITVRVRSSKLNFTLVNKTGYKIDEVYLARNNVSSWGNDVLGTDVLANNSSVDIVFDPEEAHELWDMKVVFVDYNEAVTWQDFNLAKIHKITLHWDGKTTWAIKE